MLFLPWVASTQAVRNDLSRSLLTCILILYRVIWYLSYIDILVYTWWIAKLYIFMLNKFCLSPESWVLCGMWCNSKPISMICLVFTQASSVLISSVLCCGQTLLQAFLYVLNLLASICCQQAHSWLHCIGRVCGQRGMEAMSIDHKQIILVLRLLS